MSQFYLKYSHHELHNAWSFNSNASLFLYEVYFLLTSTPSLSGHAHHQHCRGRSLLPSPVHAHPHSSPNRPGPGWPVLHTPPWLPALTSQLCLHRRVLSPAFCRWGNWVSKKWSKWQEHTATCKWQGTCAGPQACDHWATCLFHSLLLKVFSFHLYDFFSWVIQKGILGFQIVIWFNNSHLKIKTLLLAVGMFCALIWVAAR